MAQKPSMPGLMSGEKIVDQTSLDLIFDPVSPTGSLNFAKPSTQNTEVGLTLSASDSTAA